jgi:hypothetical protein
VNRTEPKIGEIDSVESLEAADSSYYLSPKANVISSESNHSISNWSPLIFLLLVYLAVGPLFSEGIKHFVSRNSGSVLHAIFTILNWVGMIWWAINDSKKYKYTLTKPRVFSIVLLGPIGIAMYSFFTRGVLGGIAFVLKMAVYILVVLLFAGLSATAFDQYVWPNFL